MISKVPTFLWIIFFPALLLLWLLLLSLTGCLHSLFIFVIWDVSVFCFRLSILLWIKRKQRTTSHSEKGQNIVLTFAKCSKKCIYGRDRGRINERKGHTKNKMTTFSIRDMSDQKKKIIDEYFQFIESRKINYSICAAVKNNNKSIKHAKRLAPKHPSNHTSNNKIIGIVYS